MSQTRACAYTNSSRLADRPRAALSLVADAVAPHRFLPNLSMSVPVPDERMSILPLPLARVRIPRLPSAAYSVPLHDAEGSVETRHSGMDKISSNSVLVIRGNEKLTTFVSVPLDI